MTEPGPNRPIVEMKGITVEFPGVRALDDVRLELRAGEVHALMGENGAGKSTLIKALTGVYRIDAGQILLDGEPIRLSGTRDAEAHGISTVYQEINLCTNISIGENVMLGQEVRGRFGINWRKTHAAARAALELLSLTGIDTRAPLGSLSLAVQQLVAIARAVVRHSRVLILDEPTSSLDAREVANLFEVVRQLRDSGVAILFVSHFLDQVFELSDRVTVLRNGSYVGQYAITELDQMSLIAKMIGREFEAYQEIASSSVLDSQDDAAPPALATTRLTRRGAIAPTSLSFRRGEVIGLAGLLGSGRTELARLLFGADRAESGSVMVAGRKVSLSSPAAALAHKIALSSENRRDEGVIGDFTVRENIILARQARRGWARPLSRREQDELVSKYTRAFDIRPADPDRLVRFMSGGNQQKILLGRWLATEPQVLILDEPTRGIDIGAKADIQNVVRDLAASGVTVIFISSELEEVVRLADRIVVLKDHRVIAELTNGPDVSVDAIVGIIAREGQTP
ncbi:MAG: sugar ABC transporter ATP-binding protein [Bifidobacteriaceae bacterium]|jgi:simple sugar transport system ATP-binding protein|nr:sugar ABC transporter ATP-binding protein [Bifidobacteriaceae bacterium]